MAALDWAFGAILLASMLLGAWRGLVYEVLSVLSWIAAFVLAQWLAPDVANWLPMGGAAVAMRYAVGFLLVFVVAVFLGGLLAWVASRAIEAIGLRPADRTLGALFGLVRGIVLLLAVTVVVGMTPLRRAGWWTESVGAGYTVAALQRLKPVLPERFGRYVPG